MEHCAGGERMNIIENQNNTEYRKSMTTINLTIGKRTIKLTAEEAKEAHRQLNELLNGPVLPSIPAIPIPYPVVIPSTFPCPLERHPWEPPAFYYPSGPTCETATPLHWFIGPTSLC